MAGLKQDIKSVNRNNMPDPIPSPPTNTNFKSEEISPAKSTASAEGGFGALAQK